MAAPGVRTVKQRHAALRLPLHRFVSFGPCGSERVQQANRCRLQPKNGLGHFPGTRRSLLCRVRNLRERGGDKGRLQGRERGCGITMASCAPVPGSMAAAASTPTRSKRKDLLPDAYADLSTLFARDRHSMVEGESVKIKVSQQPADQMEQAQREVPIC